MGFIGRILVVLHAAVALAVLTWAVGVYTQRINWNTPPATSGDESGPGVFDRQKAKVDEYNVAVDRSFTRWTANKLRVEALEAERYPRREFYAGQLAILQTGKLGGAAVPVQVPPARAANGYLDIVRTNNREAYMVRPMIPADSIDGYLAKMDRLRADINASQVRNKTALDERKKLNDEIVDLPGPPATKGLRTLISEQKAIHDRALAENVYVTGFVTNREAEFGLLVKRRDAMNARIGELRTKR